MEPLDNIYVKESYANITTREEGEQPLKTGLFTFLYINLI